MRRTLSNRQYRPLLFLIAGWDLILRMVAIRRALERREMGWTVALLIISSAGVLPMLYLRRDGRESGR
jgi:hypothetical protein